MVKNALAKKEKDKITDFILKKFSEIKFLILALKKSCVKKSCVKKSLK